MQLYNQVQKCKYVHKHYPVSSSFSTNLLTILVRLLYIYILIIQFWHYISVHVRLSYRFSASLLWMLSSLLLLCSVAESQHNTQQANLPYSQI